MHANAFVAINLLAQKSLSAIAYTLIYTLFHIVNVGVNVSTAK